MLMTKSFFSVSGLATALAIKSVSIFSWYTHSSVVVGG